MVTSNGRVQVIEPVSPAKPRKRLAPHARVASLGLYQMLTPPHMAAFPFPARALSANPLPSHLATSTAALLLNEARAAASTFRTSFLQGHEHFHLYDLLKMDDQPGQGLTVGEWESWRDTWLQ